jgi:hypothetical protein
MRTNIVMIDAENVPPDSLERLKGDHFRVLLFVGSHQRRLDLAVVKAVQVLGRNAEYIQISGTGPNALDFHIAYYIGKYAGEIPNAYFHIISKDKGFDPLIAHLKENKVPCARWASVQDIPLLKSAEELPPQDRAEQFFQARIRGAKNGPGTLTKLKNTVAVHFHKLLSQEEVLAVMQALQAAGRIEVSGSKVTYPEAGGSQPALRVYGVASGGGA